MNSSSSKSWLDVLSARRMATEVDRELMHKLPELRPLIPWSPEAPTGPQRKFLGLTCREALYGGAAGGGKSSALLFAALQYVHVPRYSALLLRRSFADLNLPGALMDRAHSWLQGRGASWNGQEKRWTFDSGATVSFGYLDTENDKYRYQGAELQFVGFDELTQFSESQYRYLLSRVRRLQGMPVPIRVRAASNPGGEGHEWVKRWFIDEGQQNGRVFVPARLDDNPHLDRAEYEQSLALLDPVTRAQLRDGDWNVLPKGPLFDRAWFAIVDEAPAECRWVRYWDLAATEAKPGKDPDFTAGGLVGMNKGRVYVADIRKTRSKPYPVEQLVKQTAELDRQKYGEIETWIEQEPGSSGVNTIDHYVREVLFGFNVRGDRKTGNKVEMAKPWSAAAQAGNVVLVRGPWNGEWLDAVSAFPSPAVHDDEVDVVSGAFAKLRSFSALAFAL